MLRDLLVVLAFWNGIHVCVSAATDTQVESLVPKAPEVVNNTGAEMFPDTDLSPKSGKVEMHGHNNYHTGQQIFYIYGPQQWRLANLLSNQMNQAGRNDYLVTPGLGAHKLHPRKLAWNKARRACIEEGGHLAIINSSSEEKLLLRLLDENGIGSAWLGVHDMFLEGEWVTLMDEALENSGYSRWTTKYPNEPDNYGGNQNCGLLMKEGGMDDIGCGSLQSFFCEISLA